MTFLQKILKTSKNDVLGIDSAADGLRQLRDRLASEQVKLTAETDKLRDRALDDPGGEIDEMPMLRQRARVKAFESAYEKALTDASTYLNAKQGELDKAIADLEQEQIALRVQRDRELLKLIREFVAATSGRLVNAPAVGVGGSIAIPAMQALDRVEVAEALQAEHGSTLSHAPTKTLSQLSKVVAELQRLKTLRHLGGKPGLEALIG